MIDPSLYRFRERLTLLECAALAHGRDPRELQRRFEESMALDYGPQLTDRQIKEMAVSCEVAETVDALEAMAGADAVTPPFGVFRFPPCECQAMLAALGLSLPWTLATQEKREANNAETAPERQIRPRKPIKRVRDAWTEVILATIDAFEAEHGFTPTAREAWTRLVNTHPDGWSYDYRQDRNDCLMAGEKLPLDQATFDQRFRRLFPATRSR